MKQKVGVYFWVRVVVMCAALVAVIAIMFKLNSPKSHELNLCPTRVSSVSLIGSLAIIQDGMTWFRAAQGERKELDQVAVEKWFGLHCMIDIEAVKGPAPSDMNPLITFAYVSGSPVTLQRSGDIFMLHGQYFRSNELTEALKELESLPVKPKPGETNP